MQINENEFNLPYQFRLFQNSMTADGPTHAIVLAYFRITRVVVGFRCEKHKKRMMG